MILLLQEAACLRRMALMEGPSSWESGLVGGGVRKKGWLGLGWEGGEGRWLTVAVHGVLGVFGYADDLGNVVGLVLG
jgi:hypothetical protein